MLHKTDDCFKCKHCGELPPDGMDNRLVDLLNNMGIQAEEINSAYRCPVHNANVGGVPNSTHVQGKAVDIDATDMGVYELSELAEQHGADGIGEYYTDMFVHVDTRGERARW